MNKKRERERPGIWKCNFENPPRTCKDQSCTESSPNNPKMMRTSNSSLLLRWPKHRPSPKPPPSPPLLSAFCKLSEAAASASDSPEARAATSASDSPEAKAASGGGDVASRCPSEKVTESETERTSTWTTACWRPHSPSSLWAIVCPISPFSSCCEGFPSNSHSVQKQSHTQHIRFNAVHTNFHSRQISDYLERKKKKDKLQEIKVIKIAKSFPIRTNCNRKIRVVDVKSQRKKTEKRGGNGREEKRLNSARASFVRFLGLGFELEMHRRRSQLARLLRRTSSRTKVLIFSISWWNPRLLPALYTFVQKKGPGCNFGRNKTVLKGFLDLKRRFYPSLINDSKIYEVLATYHIN